jgi:two-component system phosphate regulon response regulator PhoB
MKVQHGGMDTYTDVSRRPSERDAGNRRSPPRGAPGSTVLVVEDDSGIREMLTFALERAGFVTVAVGSAEEALAHFDGPPPAIAIIDWMLPGASGVDLARRLRQDPLTRSLPLIMLTARGEESDKLKSFDSGVDDHVTKPFSPRELVARVKALLRRSGASGDGVVEGGDMRIDLAGHRLTVAGAPVHLGPTEFRLLEHLMRHPDRVFDRAQLLDRVWGRSVYVEERTVDVHVLRLRKALAAHDRDRCIETVRGVGYRFVPV